MFCWAVNGRGDWGRCWGMNDERDTKKATCALRISCLS